MLCACEGDHLALTVRSGRNIMGGRKWFFSHWMHSFAAATSSTTTASMFLPSATWRRFSVGAILALYDFFPMRNGLYL